MSLDATLAGVLRGEGAAFARLLQTTRVEGFGSQAYGAEDARALFRKAPPGALEQVEAVTTARGGVLLGLDGGVPVAVAADLHAGRVTRLWRLGSGRAGAPAPSLDTPHDLDLDQRGGRLAFEPRDHRGLDPEHAARLAELGSRWLQAPPAELAELSRLRLLVLRAWSEDATTAALLRAEAGGAGGRFGFHVLVRLAGQEARIVVDAAACEAAAERPWRTSLR